MIVLIGVRIVHRTKFLYVLKCPTYGHHSVTTLCDVVLLPTGYVIQLPPFLLLHYHWRAHNCAVPHIEIPISAAYLAASNGFVYWGAKACEGNDSEARAWFLFVLMSNLTGVTEVPSTGIRTLTR